MGLMWRNLASDIDVVCMMSSLEYQFVFSSRIKEVVSLGANVDNLVPPHVAKALKSKVGLVQKAVPKALAVLDKGGAPSTSQTSSTNCAN